MSKNTARATSGRYAKGTHYTSSSNAYRRGGRTGYGEGRYQSYNYGSEAPELYPERRVQKNDNRRTRRQQDEVARSRAAVRANRERAARMNPALIAGMLAVICFMCMVLFQYISLQASVTSQVQEIASMESELTQLRANNDQAYNEIQARINLDDIKLRAIRDLGMTYAKDDQIVTYSNDTNDYVHQVTQVGN